MSWRLALRRHIDVALPILTAALLTTACGRIPPFALGNDPTDAAAPDAAARPDGAAAAVCGNGVREGLEACEDGNTDPFDGCDASCVYEGGRPPAFAILEPLSGVWMAVSGTGDTFLMEAPSGRYDPMHAVVHRIAVDGRVMPRFITDPEAPYYVHIQRLGNGIVFGSFFWPATDQGHVTIRTWQPDEQVATIHSERLTDADLGGYNTFKLAMAQGRHETFYLLGHVRRVTAMDASAIYLPAGPVYQQPMRYHEGLGRLLIASGRLLYRDGGNGAVVEHGGLPEGNIVDVTVAGDGRVFVACSETLDRWGSPCRSGAVWAIAADGSSARPFIDAYRTVLAIDWDPSTGELVYLGADWTVRRVPAGG